MSDCSAVSSSPNWTGLEVCWTGIRAPSFSFGADGEPACTSTNQLPSRKIRGRILSFASSCSGRPLSSISIVTIAPAPSGPPALTGSTLVTLPTCTPATRTGDLILRSLAERNAALNSKRSANGLDFVNPK